MRQSTQHVKRFSDAKQQSAVPLRAAIYARVSSANKQNPKSCDEQILHIKYILGKGEVNSRLYANRPIEVTESWVIKDEAISGKTVDRAGYQIILDAMGRKVRPFDILILDDLSRATRDLGSMIDLYKLAQYSGIEIISTADNLSSADANAQTYFVVKGMINDWGNAAHALRTLRGQEMKVLKGLSCGDIPFGYSTEATAHDHDGVGRDFKITIDENNAKVVRRIFKLFTEGYGRSAICKILNDDKIPWPGFHFSPVVGKGWSPSTLFRMMHNEKYIGVWDWRKTIYKTNPTTGKKVKQKRPEHEWVSHHENEKCREDLRIVSQALWNRVHKVFEEIHADDSHGIWGRFTPNVPQYMLSGFLKCAECGDNLVLICGRKSGYYGCCNANRRGICSNRRLLRRLKIEKVVVGYVQQHLTDESTFKKAADYYNSLMNEKMLKGRENVHGYEQELATTEIELKNATDAVMRGVESQTIIKAIEAKEKRKRWLSYQIQQVTASRQETVFVTPMAMREKFKKLVDALGKQPRMAAEALKKVFPSGLKMKWITDHWLISGTMALGNQGGMTEVEICLK